MYIKGETIETKIKITSVATLHAISSMFSLGLISECANPKL
jgi:hypothetical protein